MEKATGDYLFKPPAEYQTYLDTRPGITETLSRTKVEPREKLIQYIELLQNNIDLFRWALDDLERTKEAIIYGKTRAELIQTANEIGTQKIQLEVVGTRTRITGQAGYEEIPIGVSRRNEASQSGPEVPGNMGIIHYRSQALNGHLNWIPLTQISPLTSLDKFCLDRFKVLYLKFRLFR